MRAVAEAAVEWGAALQAAVADPVVAAEGAAGAVAEWGAVAEGAAGAAAEWGAAAAARAACAN